LPDFDATLLALLVGEPGDVLGPHPKRGLAIQTIALRVKAKPPPRPARHKPGQRDPGVVGGDPRRIGSGRDLDTPVEDFLYRRRRFGSAEAVALHKVLALIGHAVLHG